MTNIEKHITENNFHDIKQKNSNISILLVFIIVLFVFIYTSIGYNSENNESENSLWLLVSLTILLGGYAFNYNGKKYRLGKWLFAISFVICAIYFGLLWYGMQLGKGFNPLVSTKGNK